jgi:hypothetical protein
VWGWFSVACHHGRRTDVSDFLYNSVKTITLPNSNGRKADPRFHKRLFYFRAASPIPKYHVFDMPVEGDELKDGPFYNYARRGTWTFIAETIVSAFKCVIENRNSEMIELARAGIPLNKGKRRREESAAEIHAEGSHTPELHGKSVSYIDDAMFNEVLADCGLAPKVQGLPTVQNTRKLEDDGGTEEKPGVDDEIRALDVPRPEDASPPPEDPKATVDPKATEDPKSPEDPPVRRGLRRLSTFAFKVKRPSLKWLQSSDTETGLKGTTTTSADEIPVEELEKSHELMLWRSKSTVRAINAFLAAFFIQSITGYFAFMIAFTTPTVGLGCRSTLYLIYNLGSTLVCLILIAASYCFDCYSWELERLEIEGKRITGLDFQTKAWGAAAIVLRFIGKAIGLFNCLLILTTCVLQFMGVYQNCFCDSSYIGLGSKAYLTLEAVGDLKTQAEIYWGIGAGVTVLVVIVVCFGYFEGSRSDLERKGK